jgi:hypothetical protein
LKSLPANWLDWIFQRKKDKNSLRPDKQNDYSVAKEIRIALSYGLLIGILLLVVAIGLIEFLKVRK